MELFKVDTGLTIWMFVAFAILFFILWKFAWPVIMKTIDGRADLIDKLRTPRNSSTTHSLQPKSRFRRPATRKPTSSRKQTA